MRKKIVAGNWKMHGSKVQVAELLDNLVSQYRPVAGADCIVFPPFVYLSEAEQKLDKTDIAWGAQNVSIHGQGAYTGEIAADMLKDLGCQYTLVGHSERRTLYHEDSELVALKFEIAVKSGLTPILCVGETLAQREAGETEATIKQQLLAVLSLVEGVQLLKQGIVAYEPVWAIGTGKTATPEQAQAVHAFIREMIAQFDATVADGISILYGGSVKPVNAAQLFSMEDIDGGLIGGASLKADDFLSIYWSTVE